MLPTTEEDARAVKGEVACPGLCVEEVRDALGSSSLPSASSHHCHPFLSLVQAVALTHLPGTSYRSGGEDFIKGVMPATGCNLLPGGW